MPYLENSSISREFLVVIQQRFSFAVISSVASSRFRWICSFGTVKSLNRCFSGMTVLPYGSNDVSREGFSPYTGQVFRDLGYRGHTREDNCMLSDSRRRESSNRVYLAYVNPGLVRVAWLTPDTVRKSIVERRWHISNQNKGEYIQLTWAI